nr:glycosyltransferase family 2 protein [Nanoarchaeum sp.]
MNTFIVIPAYNEENNIASVIQGLKSNGYENIVVVDDGSKDKTYEIAKSENVHTLKHIINRGQGAALQTGVDFALLNKADIIVHFDADGQHDPEQIKDLVLPIINKQADICLGSRFLSKQKIPRSRRIVLNGGKLIIRAMYGIKLTDVHNGFRVMSRDAAQRIRIKGDGMEHASEILEQIKNKKLRYKEVPVIIKYSEETLKKGQKNSNAIRILFKMIMAKLGG